MTRLALRLAVLVCVLMTAGGAAADSTLPPGFEENTMISGLTRPTVVDWAPDGRRFIAEQDGRLLVAGPGETTPDEDEVLNIEPQVNAGGDRGLLGMALDTDFASNGYIFLLYTYELNWATKSPAQRNSLDPMVSQLLRIKVDANSNVVEQQVILGSYTSGICPTAANTLDCIPSNSDTHSIGTVRTAPDGTLFVGSGDGAGYSTVDQLAFRTYDEQSLAGKILHIDRNGQGLPGHPFCPVNNDLGHVCSKLWVKGFRNPFRFALSPPELIVGDVGWGTREEISVISAVSGGGGGSYGWPCIEGTYAGNPYAADPKCQSGQFGPQIPPIHDFAHTESSGSAVLGGPRYSGSEYPAAYQGAIVFGNYARGVLSRLDTDGPGPPTEHVFADDWWGGVNLESAPDNGDIVYVSFGDGDPGTGTVERISYSPGNGRPTARATASPTFSPTAPLTVNFNAQAPGHLSTDPDGDPLSYAWDFGDGGTSTAVAPTHQYTDPGTYEAVLTVDDGRGKSDTDSVTITAGNSPPDLPEIDYTPTYRGGGTIALSGTAHDPEDGAIAGDDLTWDVRLVHNDHDHPFFHDRPGDELEFSDLASHDADSHYEVKLTATDSGGSKTSNLVELHPETTTITLASEPPGARISYYDSTFTAPLTRTTAIGLETGVSAQERFTVNGQEYLFSSWSDGGERIHPLTVPETPTTLVARYAAVAGPPTPDPLPKPKPPVEKPKPKGPVLSLSGGRVLDGQTALHGSARDQDGVKSVFGAIYRSAPKGRCRFWSPSQRRLLGARTCGKPVWIKATLSGPATRRTWRLALKSPLPAGTYRLRMRAYDRPGTRSSRVGGSASLRLTAR